MRIAYITPYNALDVTNWSGSSSYIARALEQQSLTLVYMTVDVHSFLSTLIPRARNLSAKPFGRRYLINRAPAVLRSYARQIEGDLRQNTTDVVFSPGSLPIAYLDCRQPIAFWTDSTFAGMLGFYPRFSKLTNLSISHGNLAEQSALSRASLAFYSSDWAAQSAIQNYSVNPAKVHVIPFGANVDWNFTLNEIKGFIANRPPNCCNLLFIGVDWSRKGGDRVVEIAERVQAAGVPTHLDIVGCQPSQRLPVFAKVHGFISKSHPTGQKALLALLQQAHFLMLPSRAEAYGVAAVEAASLGVPSVVSDVGGLPTIVRHGISGFCLPADASPDQYASLILSTLDSGAYRELALSAFSDYQERLNWSIAASQVASFLRQV